MAWLPCAHSGGGGQSALRAMYIGRKPYRSVSSPWRSRDASDRMILSGSDSHRSDNETPRPLVRAAVRSVGVVGGEGTWGWSAKLDRRAARAFGGAAASCRRVGLRVSDASLAVRDNRSYSPCPCARASPLREADRPPGGVQPWEMGHRRPFSISTLAPVPRIVQSPQKVRHELKARKCRVRLTHCLRQRATPPIPLARPQVELGGPLVGRAREPENSNVQIGV